MKILVYAVASLLFASPAAYSEVWKKRKGGGTEDVVQYKVQDASPFVTSDSDILEPDANQKRPGFITYSIEADGLPARLIGITPQITENIVVTDSDGEEVDLLYFDLFEHAHGYNLEGVTGNYTIAVPEAQVDDGVALIVVSDSEIRLKTTISESDVLVGTTVTIQANMFRFTGDDIEDDPNAWANTTPLIPRDVKQVRATIETPSGKYKNAILKDKGNSGDENKGDGIYGTEYKVKEDVTKFYASADVVVIRSRSINSTEEMILDEQLEADRYGLPLEVSTVHGEMPPFLNVRAEIWSDNKSKPVGWIGGSMEPIHKNGKKWIVPLTFHSGWLTEGVFKPPFHLRNITLVNEDNGIDVLQAKSDILINGLPDLSSLKRSSNKKSDALLEAMAQGVKPSKIGVESSGVTVRKIADVNEWRRRNPVIFLHGFCAGRSTFTVRSDNFSRIVGRDFYRQIDKGVSAARYAREVATYVQAKIRNGSIDGIRGIVGHSQGGLAGATLIDDYGGIFSSHPDYDSSIRMVSMGSPYRGSSLTNSFLLNRIVNVALELFSALGANNCSFDLPYDLDPARNSTWRNSITTRTRNSIIAWRTSHRKSYWYRPKICHAVYSLAINHHDDGFIAENDGQDFAGKDHHKYRWCHTPSGSMRYPYQIGNPEFGQDVERVFNNIRTSGTTYCSSDRVDPNGDGYGWESGQSCQVYGASSSTNTSSTVNWCSSSSSNPDGDGWGWENSRSCKVR